MYEMGKRSKYLKMAGKRSRPRFLSKSLENGEDDIWEVMTW